LSGRGLGKTN